MNFFNCSNSAMVESVAHQIDGTEHDAWFAQQVQVGLDSANAGNLIPAADVEAEFWLVEL